MLSVLAARRTLGGPLGASVHAGAPPSFVAAAGNDRSTGGTLTVSVPAGVQDGDFMLAFVMVGGAGNLPATPAGWTLLDSNAGGGSAASYYRIASSEPASYSWTVANGAASTIVAYRGVDQANPVNAHGPMNRSAGSTTATGQSVTTTAGNCVIVFFWGSAIGSAGINWTDPAGWTRRATYGSWAYARADGKTQAAAGATGDAVATVTNGVGYNQLATLIAVKGA